MCELDLRAPAEVTLAARDRELLERVSAGLGEALELARRLGPLVDLAASLVPAGTPPMITAATARKRLRAWLR